MLLLLLIDVIIDDGNSTLIISMQKYAMNLDQAFVSLHVIIVNSNLNSFKCL